MKIKQKERSVDNIQCAHGFEIGDEVMFTNRYGLVFGPHVIVDFKKNFNDSLLPENTIYIDSDSPWYPVAPSSLEKVDVYNARIDDSHSSVMIEFPNRGEDCEFTTDCMWGIDGWCDRPIDRKCEAEVPAK